MGNSMIPVKKIDYDEYVRTTKMFYINEEIEKNIKEEVTQAIETLHTKMHGICLDGGLEEYIRADEKSIENLISLMNISSEKFKRVITMLRLKKGHLITGEWDLSKIRTMMIQSSDLMKEICGLLRNGADDEDYQKLIPQFYLENFKIDITTMARLSNLDDLQRLIKKGIEGRYNSEIGSAYFKEVEETIKNLCFVEGLTYSCNKYIPLIGRTAHFCIPNEQNPVVIIDVSYNITTSSTQSRYKTQQENAARKIRTFNATSENKVILVNVLDGAGWVGRQADLRAIHQCSNFVLHLDTLNQLREIIKHYY